MRTAPTSTAPRRTVYTNFKQKLQQISDSMPLQLIRRLSMRHNRRHDEEKVPKASSSKVSLSSAGPVLSESEIHKIIDCLPEYEQFRMRRVSRSIKNHVDAKVAQITKLIVTKEDVESRCRVQGGWVKHDHVRVALRLTNQTAEIAIDSRWTSRDINVAVGMMGVFRGSIVEAVLDAPIAEMLVVSLSLLELNRWYAFQCFMKATDSFSDVQDMHMMCDSNRRAEIYWPNCESLTVKTTEKQSPHLARVIDYGVCANYVFSRQRLSHIRVVYTDVKKNHKALARNVFHFRCWAGSAGFDHRFEQEFATGGQNYGTRVVWTKLSQIFVHGTVAVRQQRKRGGRERNVFKSAKKKRRAREK